MAEYNLENLCIKLDSVEDGLLELVNIVKPNWEKKDVKITKMSGGASCALYCAQYQDDQENALSVRIRDLFSDENVGPFDRQFERKVIPIVSKLGIFPKLHAMFQNGYCYQYIRGRPLSFLGRDVEPGTKFPLESIPYKAIATKLAQTHCVRIDGEDYSKTNFLQRLSEFMEEKYPTEKNDLLIQKTVVRQEFDELVEYTKNFNFNVVLCHGEPHFGNTVYNKRTGEATLVDWETAHIGYQAYDIALWSSTLMMAEFSTFPGFPKFDPDVLDKLQSEFLRHYWQEYSRLTKGTAEITENCYLEFANHVKFFRLIWYLVMVVLTGSFWDELKDRVQGPMIFGAARKVFEFYTANKNKVLVELNLKK